MKNKFGIVLSTISAIVIPAYIIYFINLVYYYFVDTIAYTNLYMTKGVTNFEMMTNHNDLTIIIPLLIALLFFIFGKKFMTSQSLFRKINIRLSLTIFSLWIISEALIRI